MISTLALLGSAAQATTGEDHSPPRASTAVERTRSGEDRQIIDNFAPVPPESEQIPFAIKYQNEDEVASLTLSLWALASGQKPPAELLNKAGLDPAAIADFNKKLGPKDQLSNSDRSLLRKSYTRDSFGKRMQARSRYLNFISKFQESFPSAAGVVPEILTVWGEARNIRGFDEADSYNQQAKMATVIHVIRNRSERQREQEPGSPGYRNKWRVVTRRFQFSAFEPYDPNFAELALGPMSNAPFSSVESLPRNDQAALRNLARIIAGMNRGDIQLSKPLVFNNTYHYLTPSLVNYTKENLANLRSQIERSGRRFMVIQIPGSQNPQFIAAVPRWSKQSALISHPPVKIKEPQKAVFQTQIVSPSDFIYFRGIR
ncbi:MAG TPA: hypothetical protein VM901_04960 [Bdellovibrionota bacterium]|nr:hypothetical protein [Bdellovibrionota bacterium]